jgi:flagellar motor switch protein FliM
VSDPAAKDMQSLVKLGLAGDRARRACERLAGAQRGLEAAVGRSLPYLARRKIAVTSEPARTALRADVMLPVAKPFFVSPLCVANAARPSGALVIDAKAIAHGLDGMLGSGRGGLPTLDPGGLTAPQSALASRLARSLVAAFDEVLAPLGAPLAIANEAPGGQGGAVLIACTVRIGEGETAGTIMLLVPAGAIETANAVEEGPVVCLAETEAAVGSVDLEIVAELGCVRIALRRIAALRVGDVIRLPLSVDAPACLHVGGSALFSGKLTTRGSQIAVEIARHGT